VKSLSSCIPVGAKFLCGRQTSNKKTNKIASLTFLASFSLLISFRFLFAPREALVVLEAVGAAADPVCNEDKVVAIAAAAVVTVTPILAQHTRPTGKHSVCSGWSTQECDKTIQAHLSNGVCLTTQAWLLDCQPRD
jgi:hypothetical protein